MNQPPRPDRVTVLRRPPVRQSTTVRSDARHTFDTFVRTIGAWWPAIPFSAGQDRVRDVTLEQRAGGRVATRPGLTAPSWTGASSWPGSRPSGS